METNTNNSPRTLEELMLYLRQTLPMPKAITCLEARESMNAVTFHWQRREFLVQKSLEVFEIRGQQIYLTGASMLMQTAIMKKSRHEKILGAVLEVVTEAEIMIGTSKRSEAGLKLLSTAKASLQKLYKSPQSKPQIVS